MIKKLLSLILVSSIISVAAQNNVGIGTNTPNPNAKLDISSTTKGFLIPRMTSAQRITLAGTLGLSDEGLMVYDTDLQKFFYWDKNIGFSGNWNQVRPGSLSDGKIWIGDATNTAIEQTMSGDVTLSNTGVATIQPNAVQGTDISISGESNNYVMQFNGTDWVAVDPNTLVVKNIYTADGSLTGNRTVTQGANTLTFSSSAINGFSVDDSTFSIDAASNRIGIGTTAPLYPIHEKRNGEASIFLENIGTGGGSVAMFTPSSSNTGGVGTVSNNDFPIFTNNTDRITVKATSGNVGIGTNIPTGKLHIVTNSIPTTTIQSSSNIGSWLSLGSTDPAGKWFDIISTATSNSEGAGKLIFTRAAGPSSTAGTILTMDWATSNVGIGTTSPTNKLEVVGNTKTTNFQMSSGATNNYVLKSDASGNGAWVDPASLTVSNIYTADGSLTGNRAVTMGVNNLNVNSTDGNLNFITSNGNFVAGNSSSTATGGLSAAFGNSNTASGPASLTSGWLNISSGTFGVALGGQQNIASGYGSFTTGLGNTATTDWAFAANRDNQALGRQTFVTGENNIASGYSSSVFGVNSQAYSYGEHVIGMYGTSYTPTSTSAYVSTDRLFNVGNGSSSGTRSDALTILKNGNIGISTSSPNASAKLDITASDKGILIPRVSLTASNIAGPITSPATSLLVYNTATAGTAPNNVTPGYYYWDGIKWVKFMMNNTNTTDLGYIVAWTSNTTPPDYLLPLNGLTYNWSDFPDFQAFNASYPCQFIASSTGTTFTLVNINTGGRFLRGATTAGVNQAFSTALPTSAFTTNTTGSHVHSVDPPITSTSTNGAHTHNVGLRSNDGGWAAGNPNAFHFNMSSGGGGVSTSDRGATSNANTGIIISNGDHAHTTDIAAFNSASNGDHAHTINAGGDAETRPVNTSVIWCIKVKPTATSGSLTINNTASLATNGLTVYGGPIGLGGTLNQTTTVTQNANPLAFTSTATNGFSVDGSTFSVDAANDRIGVGTTSPSDKLDIIANSGRNVLIGGGATTGSELKLTNTGTAHFSIFNSGNSKLTFANTSSLFNTNVAGTTLMTIDNSGLVNIANLAGTGNRPVFADASGNLTTPQLPKSTQVWNQNSNLPAINNTAFTTTAGSKITVIASGSGFRATAGVIGMDIYIDGVFRGSCKSYTNEVNSHKAFTTNALVVTGLAAGTHSMQLILRTGADATTSDLNDFFSATVIETPY